MGLVHGLPGTTFSDIGQRGRYDSDKAACLTLEELERCLTGWLTPSASANRIEDGPLCRISHNALSQVLSGSLVACKGVRVVTVN